MNFLQSLTKQVSKKQYVLEEKTQTQTQESKAVKKIKFTHTNNVILKTGNYKGYYGSVYRIQPARYELLLKEIQYVYVKDYGVKEIGSSIFTEFGESKIINRIPILYNIIDEVSKEQLRYPEEYIRRVVVFKDKGIKKVGMLSGVQIIEGKKYYAIRPYILDYEMRDTQDELIAKLIKNLSKTKSHDSLLSNKKQNFTDDMEEIISKMKKQLIFKEENEEQLYVYVNENNIFKDFYIIINNDKNFGKYGNLSHSIDEQYMIIHNTFTLVSQMNVKLDNKTKSGKIGDTCTILHGLFKNKKATIIGVFSEIITVFVEAAGKKINTVEIIENNKIQTRPLTKDDIFYMDIRLKNGNYFQVSKVLENDNFEGTERIIGKDLVNRQITINEVDSFQTGFGYKIDQDVTSEQVILSDVELVEEPEEIAEVDLMQEDDEKEMTGEYEEGDEEIPEKDETDTQIESYMQIEENGKKDNEASDEQYLSSFKDVERTQFVARKLSQEERSIKTTITTLLNKFELNDSDIKMYDTIDIIKFLMSKMKEMVNKMMENYWKKSDEKYIIACIVLYEILRLDNRTIANQLLKGNVLENYVNKINTFKPAFFGESDFVSTIFLTNEWADDIFKVDTTAIRSMIKAKNYIQIYKTMMENCHNTIQSFIPANQKISLTPKTISIENELIPLGLNKQTPEVRRIIYSKDVLSGNIPKEAEKIIWGPQFQDIIEKYKTLLRNKVIGNVFDSENKTWVFKNTPNKTTSDVYKYVLENLEQSPLVLRDLSKSKTKLDERKLKELERIFTRMLDDIREVDSKSKQKTQQKRENILKELEKTNEKREMIQTQNRLLGLTIDNESEDEEQEIRPKRRRRIL